MLCGWGGGGEKTPRRIKTAFVTWRERERERREKCISNNTTHSFGFHFIGNIRRKRLHTSLSLKSKLSLKMSSLYSSGLARHRM